MKTILYEYPLPLGGFILGFASLGNLLQSYGPYGGTVRNVLGGVSGILFLLFMGKLIFYSKKVKAELNNPLVASVFPTFFMAMTVLASYIKPYFPVFSAIIWVSGGIFHLIFMIWFNLKFTMQFNIKYVFPTWFVMYAGIAVMSVTASFMGIKMVGQMAFWVGLVVYIFLLVLVLYRVLRVKDMPEAALPTLVILAAPNSMFLAGYLNSFTEHNIMLIKLLLTMSILFYAAILILLPRLLSLKFYTSYSAFTFPLVISATAMKLADDFFTKGQQTIPLLHELAWLQLWLAVLITLYVFFKYLQYLITTMKEEKEKKVFSQKDKTYEI
ncbi:TDT family transporter [Dehalobacterium formicoaceticum]|uniref:TDT family transporter n=1 Tax=Dehalobacterium formicoaceticum TaxID=51515 RepID=A0ABT1Y1Y2_9FIRM|nr:TDT family transporter [Dehalobacterium formicoaceticum]MCR6544860.1 TDT family transporter [Dehalobacterium formicoaceticum]